MSATGFYAAGIAAVAGFATLVGALALTTTVGSLTVVLVLLLATHWSAGILLVVGGVLLALHARRRVLVVGAALALALSVFYAVYLAYDDPPFLVVPIGFTVLTLAALGLALTPAAVRRAV